MWRNAIRWKFRVERGGWASGVARGAYGIGVWKEIRKEWDTLFSNVVFSLGKDRRVSFWKDIWCGEEAFCDAFPSLYALASKQRGFRGGYVGALKRGGGLVPLLYQTLQ